MADVVQVNADLTKIDKSIKNKFKWDWLREKDPNGVFYSDYVRKVVTPGVCICVWCNNKALKYGSSGKKILKLHSTSSPHIDAMKSLKSQQTLPSTLKFTVKFTVPKERIPHRWLSIFDVLGVEPPNDDGVQSAVLRMAEE